ncbi:tetraspanin Tsp3 [Diplocarpon rosae]|nr:tetraspanin Tsp3 [Diplocarpon rosae]
MSTLPKKLAIFAIPLLLLALTATAGYAYSQIRSLSLPIPRALALFTVILPFITGISARSTYGLVRRSANAEPYQLTIPLIAVIGFQLIYVTIIATLALTHIVPPIALNCGLQSKWLQLRRVKDADAIRAIQDTFACCGLNTNAENYHDEPNEEPSSQAIDAPNRDTDQGPIVLPSHLTHDGHEWRT